ncbi:hypothetical protein, partial [Pseudomonas aeruginosa]|uniref:hypothetical protein n=1 Tax=Pseudomonas aeruginosa TaxID=287 RepID=UPI001115333D
MARHAAVGGDDADRRLADAAGLVADADIGVVRHRQHCADAEALADQLAGVGRVGGEFGAGIALDEHIALAAARTAQLQVPALTVQVVEVVAHGRHARFAEAEIGVDHARGERRRFDAAPGRTFHLDLPVGLRRCEHEQAQRTVLDRQRALPHVASGAVGGELHRQQGAARVDHGIGRQWRAHRGHFLRRAGQLLGKRQRAGVALGEQRRGGDEDQCRLGARIS